MIAHLTGVVLHHSGTAVIVDVAGVGYHVHTLLEVAATAETGSEISLWTHLVVREHALELYGFADRETLEFFGLLISVSGVGPKSALAILSLADPKTIKGAVAGGDHSYLTKVSGIGKKSAERIVLELKDKLGALETESGHAARTDDSEVLEALISMGYSTTDARAALKTLPAQPGGISDRLKAALKQLGNK